MLAVPIRVTVICFTAMFLAACGGGNGGGGNTPYTNNSELFGDGTVEIPGEAVTSDVRFSPGNGSTVLSNVSGPGRSFAFVTSDDGRGFILEYRADGSQVVFNLDTDSTVESSGPIAAFTSRDGDRIAFFLVGGFEPFEHQVFGSWVSGLQSGRGTAGAGIYGARTPLANIPQGQTATYEGLSSGIATLSDGEGYTTLSVIEVRTDFSTASITSMNTEAVNLRTAEVIAANELDFAGGGAVINGEFSAFVSGPVVIGTADGVFNGPNAEEVGGTFSLSGPDSITYIGAFGAK